LRFFLSFFDIVFLVLRFSTGGGNDLFPRSPVKSGVVEHNHKLTAHIALRPERDDDHGETFSSRFCGTSPRPNGSDNMNVNFHADLPGGTVSARTHV
jgi:hypothetical protein